MIFDDHNGHRQGEVEAAHSLLSQTAFLLDESRALSYALAMVLARARARSYRAKRSMHYVS